MNNTKQFKKFSLFSLVSENSDNYCDGNKEDNKILRVLNKNRNQRFISVLILFCTSILVQENSGANYNQEISY